MQFCPVCSNLLLLGPGDFSQFLKCQVCPYMFEIKNNYSTEVKLKHRKVGSSPWPTISLLSSPPLFPSSSPLLVILLVQLTTSTSLLMCLISMQDTEEVLGGADAWNNVDKTQARCPDCQHDTAYFMQIQIRSADEPMTCFYKCCKCSTQWNE